MSPDFMNNIATVAGVIVAALGAFVFAFWVALGIWTFNDIRARSRDWLATILAVLLVMVFPIVGLILYLLIRPKTTLADVYDRALEEEALLRELEETHACHSCGVPVKPTWVYCPNCHQQLQHSCPNCSNLVRNEWAICVYCGTSQRAGQTLRGANELPATNVYVPGSLSAAPALATGSMAATTTPSSVSAAGAPSGAGGAPVRRAPAPILLRLPRVRPPAPPQARAVTVPSQHKVTHPHRPPRPPPIWMTPTTALRLTRRGEMPGVGGRESVVGSRWSGVGSRESGVGSRVIAEMERRPRQIDVAAVMYAVAAWNDFWIVSQTSRSGALHRNRL